MRGRARLLLATLGAAAAAGVVLLIATFLPLVHDAMTSKHIPRVALIDDRSEAFSFDRLRGSGYALYFGYTHCPDVCPITLAKLERSQRALPADERKMPIVFVTVDPSRDTPAVLHRYLALFGTNLIGITGSPSSLKSLYQTLGIWSVRIGRGPNYEMGHTSTVFFVDRWGYVHSIHDETDDSSTLAQAFMGVS